LRAAVQATPEAMLFSLEWRTVVSDRSGRSLAQASGSWAVSGSLYE